MIFIVVKHPVRAEYADRWPELTRNLTATTRAEPGNISLEWAGSADDPNEWVLVEAFRQDRCARMTEFDVVGDSVLVRVELRGLEPLTPCLPGKCSTS